jgi:F420-0:gamma-glutamyl ligase-like protein
VYSKPGQFLQRLKHLAAPANELIEGGADHGNDRAVTLNVHVDVTVEVRHVQQALDIVGRYFALELEVGNRPASGPAGFIRLGSIARTILIVRPLAVGPDVVRPVVIDVRGVNVLQPDFIRGVAIFDAAITAGFVRL